MPTEILMPALSPTMEEGTLAKWLVNEGDAIAPGDVIAEIETDKATMEVEAVDEGKLGKILVDEGTENVAINTPIAMLLLEDEDESDLKDTASKSKSSDAKSDDDESEADDDDEEKDDAKAEDDEAEDDEDDEADKKKAKDKKSDDEDSSGATEAAKPPEPDEPSVADDPDIPDGTQFVEMTMREALRDAMAEELRRDETVFIIGEEVAEYEGAYKVTQGLLAEFGARRVIDTPITEHGFTGLAVGAAFGKLRPVLEFMTFNFAMQAIDQIVNSAAKTLYMSGGQMGCPIVFRGPNGAAARVAAQHSQDYTAWYAQVPGLKVIAPYTAADAKGLLKAAIRDPNPIIFLENEILYGRTFEVPDLDDYVLPIGKAKVAREGKDVTIVSFAIGMTYALGAAEKLAEEGIEAEVIDLRTIKPMDVETIVTSVKKTNRIVTVEEGWSICGIGAEITALMMERAFDYLDAPVTRVAGKNVPMPYAANLEKLALPNIDQVVEAAKAVCYVED